MGINPETGLITGTSDGKGGTVILSVTLTKERRLVQDEMPLSGETSISITKRMRAWGR